MNKEFFESIIQKLSETKDENGSPLNMDTLIISQGNKVFKPSYHTEINKHELRSLSKPIVALAVGIAINEGLKLRGEQISLQTLIYPFFKDKVTIRNKENERKWEQITLYHLLTHSIGHAEGLMFGRQIQGKNPSTFLDYIFNGDIVANPGSRFVYSNVGPYLLSVLIQDELGINLSDWVNHLLFQKIGITDYEWRNYGNYCAGATGLQLFSTDLHKIGELLINGGRYNNQQVVPRLWVDQMTSAQILIADAKDDSHNVLPKWSYGFFVFISKNENYFIEGAY